MDSSLDDSSDNHWWVEHYVEHRTFQRSWPFCCEGWEYITRPLPSLQNDFHQKLWCFGVDHDDFLFEGKTWVPSVKRETKKTNLPKKIWQPAFFWFKVTQEMRSSFLWRVVMPNLSFFCKSVSLFGSYMGMLPTNQQKVVDPQSCGPQKKPPTFHYTSCLIIGIHVMVYYNPYRTG